MGWGEDVALAARRFVKPLSEGASKLFTKSGGQAVEEGLSKLDNAAAKSSKASGQGAVKTGAQGIDETAQQWAALAEKGAVKVMVERPLSWSEASTIAKNTAAPLDRKLTELAGRGKDADEFLKDLLKEKAASGVTRAERDAVANNPALAQSEVGRKLQERVGDMKDAAEITLRKKSNLRYKPASGSTLTGELDTMARASGPNPTKAELTRMEKAVAHFRNGKYEGGFDSEIGKKPVFPGIAPNEAASIQGMTHIPKAIREEVQRAADLANPALKGLGRSWFENHIAAPVNMMINYPVATLMKPFVWTKDLVVPSAGTTRKAAFFKLAATDALVSVAHPGWDLALNDKPLSKAAGETGQNMMYNALDVASVPFELGGFGIDIGSAVASHIPSVSAETLEKMREAGDKLRDIPGEAVMGTLTITKEVTNGAYKAFVDRASDAMVEKELRRHKDTLIPPSLPQSDGTSPSLYPEKDVKPIETSSAEALKIYTAVMIKTMGKSPVIRTMETVEPPKLFIG